MKPVKKIVRAMLTKYLKASLKWKKSMTTWKMSLLWRTLWIGAENKCWNGLREDRRDWGGKELARGSSETLLRKVILLTWFHAGHPFWHFVILSKCLTICQLKFHG
jgi:hypothetical protein